MAIGPCSFKQAGFVQYSPLGKHTRQVEQKRSMSHSLSTSTKCRVSKYDERGRPDGTE